jgi:putative membrane protein
MPEAWIGLYCGPAPVPAGLWAAWNLDPLLLVALALAAWALRRSRAGLAVLAVTFVSPLCALSSALFAARTVHHVLLVAVAAPLLAAALPARGAPAMAAPFMAASAVLWLWHLPAAYDLALSNMAVYWAMQATLLLSAVAFWRAVLADGADPVAAILSVVGAFVLMALLGAVLTLAPQALYAAHATAPMAWGLLPVQDQQIGGLIMWVPAGVPYAAAGAVLARRAWAAAGSRAA